MGIRIRPLSGRTAGMAIEEEYESIKKRVWEKTDVSVRFGEKDCKGPATAVIMRGI